MDTNPKNKIQPNDDGIDRRGFLKCMAWAGTGVLWSVHGGILSSRALGSIPPATQRASADFTFAQLSDSHIGFAKEPNKDVVGTLKLAIDRLNRSNPSLAFVLHTGDLTHLSKPAEFDTVAQMLSTVKAQRTFYVPGEHDVFTDDGKEYLARHGKGTQGNGWHSFDYRGAHFIGLVNVMNLKAGGMGVLGPEQLAWMKKDLEGMGGNTPVVVFAHVPLWSVYPKWGWGTEDSAQALALLKRFAAVTVLNGHIHQAMQKIEGNVTFHTACSTAFPQPAPGGAESPGPIKNVPAEKLRSMLGLTQVNYIQTPTSLAIVDSSL